MLVGWSVSGLVSLCGASAQTFPDDMGLRAKTLRAYDADGKMSLMGMLTDLWPVAPGCARAWVLLYIYQPKDLNEMRGTPVTLGLWRASAWLRLMCVTLWRSAANQGTGVVSLGRRWPRAACVGTACPRRAVPSNINPHHT